MQTLVLETPGVFAWKEAAEPEPGPGEDFAEDRVQIGFQAPFEPINGRLL